MIRAKRNRFIERWAGREWALRQCQAEVLDKIRAARKAGDTDEATLSYGQDAGLINEILPVGEIVRRIANDAEDVMSNYLRALINRSGNFVIVKTSNLAGNPTTASNVRFAKSGDQQGVCSKRSSLSHHGCMISISSGVLSFSLAPLRGLACAVPRRTGAIWKAAWQADRARRDQFLTILWPALQNVALSRGRQVRGL